MDTDSNASQKQRAKDSLDEVLAFCENKSDCRRTQVLAFFGETFDRVNCHNGCDTCLAHDKTTWRKEDVTEAAKEVVQLIQALDKRDRITIKNAAECYRGFGGNTGKGWGDNPMYGVGKAWNRNDAERLIQTLLIHKALDTYLVANNAGWSNSYLKVGTLFHHPYMYEQRGRPRVPLIHVARQKRQCLSSGLQTTHYGVSPKVSPESTDEPPRSGPTRRHDIHQQPHCSSTIPPSDRRRGTGIRQFRVGRYRRRLHAFRSWRRRDGSNRGIRDR